MIPSPPLPLAADQRSVLRQRERAATALLVAAFTYVFLANAWLGDDAYISFRVVWNVLHGHGLVFNAGERVQAYTHPLWLMVIASSYAVTRELFFTSLVVSYAFTLAAILVVARHAEHVGAGAVAVLTLLTSKAFVDYTSSGLEYPLSYLLLALFYARFLRVSNVSLSDGELRWFGVLAGLAFVNRIDSVLLYAVPLAWLVLRALRRSDERLLPLVVAFTLPGFVWLSFATIYYGFPLPNTYYAKVATGIPNSLLYGQGVAYVLNSFAHDPITLGTLGIAAALSWRSAAPVRMSTASALLYVLYTISVGGDFMSGRFFAMPFLVATIVLFHRLREIPSHAGAAGVLVAYNVLMPIVPIKTTGSYDAAWPWRSQNGIKDERGHYHRPTNVFFYSPFRDLPDHPWMREGLSFRNGPEKVAVQGSIGYFGLAAGPDKHVLDRNALSDPLLARLPVSPRLYFEFYAGHYFRDLPDRYLETLAGGTNQLSDPLLHEYYDRLLDVLRGPLFSTARLRSIWYLNVGEGRSLATRYESPRAISLSVPAANERFLADAGERDVAAGVIRSVGRSGYLQYGPAIPMKAGVYRARWVGRMDGVPAGSYGFVDVWADGRRLARREIGGIDVHPDRRRLAELDFVLSEPVDRLDYRIWVDGRHPVVLERVELFSGGGARPDE